MTTAEPIRKSIGAAYALAVLCFLAALLQYYRPLVGFSSLLMLGDAFERRQVEALRHIPHYTHEDSWGYDGQFYVQLALNPTLTNPELAAALDNPTYRARRMLCYWLAWALGFGRPAWIVQAYALLNAACWLLLAGLLLHWFPPTRWENFIRWGGVMFSCGLFASVFNALVDGPSLLLIALALWALERRRRSAGLGFVAAAGLARETGLLSVTALFDRTDARDATPVRRGLSWAGVAVLAALPLVLWLGYLHFRFGPPDRQELRNFTLPLAGLAEQWGSLLANFVEHPLRRVNGLVLVATTAITAQFLFFITRPRAREPWWRVGASFGVLLAFLATPVWEGFPGAYSRVLLPMTLAFNVLVPAGRRWLPWLILGNLGVLVAVHGALQVPRDFVAMNGPGEAVSQIRLRFGPEWHPTESRGTERWRWSSGNAVATFRNSGPAALNVRLRARLAPARDSRGLEIAAGGQILWSQRQMPDTAPVEFSLRLPPGDTILAFRTDQTGHSIGNDRRVLAFKLSNVDLTIGRDGAP